MDSIHSIPIYFTIPKVKYSLKYHSVRNLMYCKGCVRVLNYYFLSQNGNETVIDENTTSYKMRTH